MDPKSAIFFPRVTKEYRLIVQMWTTAYTVHIVSPYDDDSVASCTENEASAFKEANKKPSRLIYFCFNKFTLKPCPVL